MPGDPLNPSEVESLLATSAEFLTLVLADDVESIERLRREQSDVEGWNVALTLAYLLRDIFRGQPTALELLAQSLRDAQAESRIAEN